MSSTPKRMRRRSAGAQRAARRQHPPRHFLERWPVVVKKLTGARRAVVFLDFDGTLVRLRRRPEDVHLGSPGRKILRRLARRPRLSLYFISGRGLLELRRLVRVPGAHYLGLHGWERGQGGPVDASQKKHLAQAKKFIEQRIRNLAGVWIQDKRACLAVHYRAASAAGAERARPVVMDALERLGPEFRLLAGKKIWEILPRQLGTKGDAAREVLAQLGGRPVIFYFGDDTTDETAFAALKAAFTVRVGKFHRTRARFYLRGPGEVLEFLAKLDGVLKEKPGGRRPESEAGRPRASCAHYYGA